jgi:hypothetical protein
LKPALQANGIQTPLHAAIEGRSLQSSLQNDAEVQGSDDEVLMIGDTTNVNYATTTCDISFLNKFDNWTQINALLHKIALHSNKQISMVGGEKVYHCQEWIASRLKWLQRVKNEAVSTFLTNTWQQRAMIDANPFDVNSCFYICGRI